MTGPLQNLLVLDLSRVLAGPACGQLLADLGARVIKIENPLGGDETRTWGPPYVGEVSSYFRCANRGKEFLTLNLADPDGRKLLDAFLSKADVLIENFLPQARLKLGLNHNEILANHPRLVVANINGYGLHSNRPGYDFVVQAESGMMSIAGEPEGEPVKTPVALTDLATGQYAVSGVLAKLLERERTGKGGLISVSLMDTALANLANIGQACLDTEKAPVRRGNSHYQIFPYDLFGAADGRFVLAVGNDRQWRELCEILGAMDISHLTNGERLQRRDALTTRLQAEFSSRRLDEWDRVFRSKSIPFGRVNSVMEAFEYHGNTLQTEGEEQSASRSMPCPVRFGSNEESSPRREPGQQGEDSGLLLKEFCGIDNSQFKALKEKGLV